MSITVNTTVGELVAEQPGRSRIFEQLGIDYCCGGKKPLQEVCSGHGLDAETVVQMLQAFDQSPDAGNSIDWTKAPLTDLIEHIETTHHAYLREALPRLDMLADRVSSRHGAQYPWLIELYDTLSELTDALEDHLVAEEVLVFPAIRELVNDPKAGSPDKLEKMEDEHEEAGAALAQMRRLAGNYQPPEGACNSFRALLHGLEELERDMHQHVHKENNILFPRARAAVPA